LASKESIVKKSPFGAAQIVGILKEHEAGEPSIRCAQVINEGVGTHAQQGAR
jgi:hypothetical protein